MRNVLLKLDDDQLAGIDAAFKDAQAAWGTLVKMVDINGDSPANPYLGYLLLDTDKTAHKVNALIGAGIAFADLLGRREREGRSQMVVRMTAHRVWPDVILPAATCALSGMPVDDFIALVAEKDPSGD